MGFLFSNLKRVAVVSVILIAAVVVAAILIGSLPSRSTIDGLKTRISRLEQRNAVLEQSLKIAELRGAAGLMSYRVNQNDYGAAAELSTGFFNGVREIISEAENQAVRLNLQGHAPGARRDYRRFSPVRSGDEAKAAQIYADFSDKRSGLSWMDRLIKQPPRAVMQ